MEKCAFERKVSVKTSPPIDLHKSSREALFSKPYPMPPQRNLENMAAMDTEQGIFPPRPVPETDAVAREIPRGFRIFLSVFFGSMDLFVMVLILWVIVEGIMYKEPNYSVAIAAVSGLDPVTDIGRRPALDPEFNLTVVVKPRSPLMHACAYPGTTMRVSYHGFELASVVVPKFCEADGTHTVIARGGRVWLPGPALDSRAADMRRAAGVFDVTIMIMYTEGSKGVLHGPVVSCMGRHAGEDVGGGGGALCFDE